MGIESETACGEQNFGEMDSFDCTVTIIADIAVALPKAYTRSVCRASDFVQTAFWEA